MTRAVARPGDTVDPMPDETGGPVAVRPRQRVTVRVVGLAIIALALAPLLVASPAAHAAEQRITAPAAGTTATGPVTVVAQVTPDAGEVIQGVTARLVGPVERSAALERGTSEGEWRGTLDPTTRPALPNGTYQLAVQATPVVGPPSDPATVELDLAVPPPRRELTAEPDAADATRVVMSWEPVALPDFIAYRVQRRPDADDGEWTTVHRLEDPRADGVVDTVGQPGPYRYRLIVVRADGRGGELFATSPIRGVTADPADPGTFTPPPEPEPRPAGTPEPQPGVPPGGPVQRPDDTPGAGPTPTPTTPPTQTADAPPAQRPQATVRPPAIDDGADAEVVTPPRPDIIPADDGVFEELLPFEATESEVEVTDTEAAFIDGSTREGGSLAVYTEEAESPRGVLTAIAGGLVLLVSSAHVRRFMSGAGGR